MRQIALISLSATVIMLKFTSKLSRSGFDEKSECLKTNVTRTISRRLSNVVHSSPG